MLPGREPWSLEPSVAVDELAPMEASILFPCSPVDRNAVEPAYTSEFEAARAAGFTTTLYSHEAVEAGDLASAVRQCRADNIYILRGWMMTGDQYEQFASAMTMRRSRLLTEPSGYNEAHYLPLAYPHLIGETPRSAWIEGDDSSRAWELYQKFESDDAVIKDWVKSAKHRWNDACFIPAHCTPHRFGEIFRNFRQARGHLFNRGVVIRQYERLTSSGKDLRGFPLIEEYRLFFFRHQLLGYPDHDGVAAVLDRSDHWHGLALRFRSPFLSMDVAKLENGKWTVIEVGDGGVSGLPLSIDPTRFYTALFKASAELDQS